MLISCFTHISYVIHVSHVFLILHVNFINCFSVCKKAGKLDEESDEDDSDAEEEVETDCRGTNKSNSESPWTPRFMSHMCPANNHHREQILIETPGSFSGEEGSHIVTFEKNCTELAVKTPPNDMFNTPSVIHMHQSSKHLRSLSSDSARVHSFNAATRGKRSHWSVFRHKCSFRATKSDDLDAVPWIDFAEIEHEGKVTPMLIIEIKSISPIETKETKDEITSKLTKNVHKSPEPVRGVNFSSNNMAQQAHLFEQFLRQMHINPNFKRDNNDVNSNNVNVDGDNYSASFPKKFKNQDE